MYHTSAGRLHVPWSLPLLWLLLTLIGWVAIARCETLSDGGGRYLRLQIFWTFLSAGAMAGVAWVGTHPLQRWSYALFAVAIVLLCAVFFFPPINNAHRWIRVAGLGFQPSELAKLATVLALSRYLAYRENYRRWWGLFAPAAIVLAPAVLILREPDLGTALLFMPLMVVMVFVAGARRIDLARLLVIALLMTPVLWSQMSREQRGRVTSLFHQSGPGQASRDDSYQLRQAKRMVALGARWGSLAQGTPHDDPAVYHLPEARSDFIFCVVAERLGLPGALGVLCLYGLFVLKAAALAIATEDPFGRLVAIGIASLFAMQVFVNTAMNVGLLPITGMSLPLLSYGGSGLLVHSLGVGILVRLGMHHPLRIANEPFRYVA